MGFSIAFKASKQFSTNKRILAIVSKPIERIRGTLRADERSVLLDYFESEEVNSSKNIVIEDNSINYTFNDRRKLDDQLFKKVEGLNFFSEYKEILITPFKGKNKHGEVIPLFYKHKKSDKTKKIVNVSVRKITNKNIEDDINYGFSIYKGNVYFNYKNTFNLIKDEYTLYYLNISYEDGSSENSIINPTKAIEKAEFDTIDSEYTYTSFKKSNGYEYNISLAGETIPQFRCSTGSSDVSFYVKELEKNSLYIKSIENQLISQEWLIEINAGEVFRLLNNQIYRYYIPEFKEQPFSIEAPNILLLDKECEIVTTRVIKLPKNPISYSNEMQINISKYDLNNNLIEENLEIESVDESRGFINLANALNFGESFRIKANFYYKSETFILNSLNVNPYENKEAINELYHVYVKPNEDIKSIVVLKESELQTNNEDKSTWLYLGNVSYEEDYNLENALTFSMKNYNKYVDFEKAVGKNPWILQSKDGYGNKGQVIQKNNIVIMNVPTSYRNQEEYTEEELVNLFKRKLKPSTNLIINYEDDLPALTLSNTGTGINAEWTFEGLGDYKLYRKDLETNENILIYYVEYTKFNHPSRPEYKDSFEDLNVQNEKRYSYYIEYNGLKDESKYLEIKVDINNE